LALDAKKIYVGFIATVFTVVIAMVAALAYRGLNHLGLLSAPSRSLLQLGNDAGTSILWHFGEGTGMDVVSAFLVLLNPFYGNLAHFILSVLVYVALFWAWSGTGGVVARLAALEYARDDMPTLQEARAMVNARRRAYFLAPLMPLVVIVFLSALNMIGGLIASGWYIGRILLIFPGFPLLVASTAIIVFLIVFGILSFGLMMPAVSVGGKDAFESWSTAYSYVLWGPRRFISYSVLAGVLGAIAVVVAWGLTEFLIYALCRTVNMGYISSMPWIHYDASAAGGRVAISILPWGGGLWSVLSAIVVALLIVVRALPVAYAFAYFFTAGTVIFFLMRKDQDNIEVEELYEEAAEEEEEIGEGAKEPAPEEKEPSADEKGQLEAGDAAKEGPQAEGDEEQP
jgi:hypothetical protein